MPADSQADWRTLVGGLLAAPWVLALVVTVANAAKPVLIDDAAYLAYARQVAAHPGDPYGFVMFWWTVPEPAMTVLVPPVVPYWLAINVAAFGEHPWLLKLWLYPFVWALGWALRDLLRRFARGAETRVLPLLMLSPAVLPTVNLMLDLPALGLGLAAVAVFARAADRSSWPLAAAAGALAALAMQTKYTALLVPPALLWYGVTHRGIRLALVAVAVSVAGFAAWEGFLVAKYGQSHFLFHLAERQSATATLAEQLHKKADLAPPLAGHLGCLGIGVTLLAACVLGVPRNVVAAAAVLWAGCFARIVFAPPGEVPVAAFWQSFGWLFLVGLVLSARPLLFRGWVRVRRSGDAVFVGGWVLLEVAGYFALTPFPAARRVIGLALVGGVLVARLLSRVERARPHRRPPGWVFAFGIATGVGVAGLDTLDAFPEKVCAERAAEIVAAERPTGTVWFAGHWGFQFYCERAGMRLVVPGGSVPRPGDVLVLPAYPNEDELFRPHAGSVTIAPPPWAAAAVGEVVWDDPLAGQTVPNFYAGYNPVEGRRHPRLRVVVYRVVAPWAVPGE
ncbi:Uncharacterized protein OS=Fibrisoma limi BUZ 3 GN=BN8_03996 PE=4 SV=1: PMT_2 [Gemmataceae bacterium]|nr:Uncharacterized protein OS=Fibrisoma limi BUZ 3 GN=BN8_03996 PE=4 SV=1: PMT_2 [Gemmataceae bacterium]VTT97248.1 Uncharacterized protein OS=Fibrisoma limi BUZ 3 GN=BN8_03996 PE=4 SV=1: PMT_2 [Gemmataceae bacterium]